MVLYLKNYLQNVSSTVAIRNPLRCNGLSHTSPYDAARTFFKMDKTFQISCTYERNLAKSRSKSIWNREIYYLNEKIIMYKTSLLAPIFSAIRRSCSTDNSLALVSNIVNLEKIKCELIISTTELVETDIYSKKIYIFWFNSLFN